MLYVISGVYGDVIRNCKEPKKDPKLLLLGSYLWYDIIALFWTTIIMSRDVVQKLVYNGNPLLSSTWAVPFTFRRKGFFQPYLSSELTAVEW